MANESFHRSFLAISSVSLLGSCETRFMDAMQGKQKVTKPMQVGKIMHEKLVEKLPKISPEQVMTQIKEGKQFGVREFTITDKKYRLVGRIDQLNLLGVVKNGRSQGVIIDDKYPTTEYRTLPLYYKLQLSTYAAAVNNSEQLGAICEVIGISLVCREKVTHNVLKTFNIEGSELERCKSNVKIAAEKAWDLYDGKKTPEHRRFDVGTGEFVGCYCNWINQ